MVDCRYEYIKYVVMAEYIYFVPAILLPDIDECERNISCPAYARCVNNDGSYHCQCNDGFSGDGSTNCVGKYN